MIGDCRACDEIGRDIDYRALRAFAHFRQHGPAQSVGGPECAVDLGLVVGPFEIPEHLPVLRIEGIGVKGVVYEHVDFPERADRCLHQGRCGIAVGDVRLEGEGIPAGGAAVGDDALGGRFVLEVVDRDSCAFGRKALGDPSTYSPARARHENNLIPEIHYPGPFVGRLLSDT